MLSDQAVHYYLLCHHFMIVNFRFAEEEIRCVFDDNLKIFFVKFQRGHSNEHPQHRFL